MSRYVDDKNVDGRMGETRKKRKKYDSNMSCIFDTAKYLR
jgi:hypothetical protein